MISSLSTFMLFFTVIISRISDRRSDGICSQGFCLGRMERSSCDDKAWLVLLLSAEPPFISQKEHHGMVFLVVSAWKELSLQRHEAIALTPLRPLLLTARADVFVLMIIPHQAPDSQKLQRTRYPIDHRLRPGSHAQHRLRPTSDLRPARISNDQRTKTFASRCLA